MDERSRRRARIEAAYSPKLFEDTGGALVGAFARYLRDCQARTSPALPWQAPERLVERASGLLRATPAEGPGGDDGAVNAFRRLAAEFLASANHLHAPSYMGHQVSPALPMAGLGEMLGALANQGMAVYEMGPFSTAAERALIEHLGSRIGYPPGTFDGIGTDGGALANTTALLAARNVRLPGSWEDGVAAAARDGLRPAIVTSAESHYSVARSAGLLGLGTSQIVRAPIDGARRIDLSRLGSTLAEARARGLRPFALVASACTTPTGAFDPIESLADVATREGLWLHVDGAHGASVLLSRRHRHKLAGAERADSLIWDAHKMMFTPALGSFVFYREAAVSYQAFKQDAPYLFDPAAPSRSATFDAAVRTLECTKRSFAMGLYALFIAFGEGLFEALVDETFELATTLHGLAQEAPDFRALHTPEANIFCFRHVPEALRDADDARLGDFQASLRKRLVESGERYITQTKIDGVPALRVTLMNPLSTDDDLRGLLADLRRHGRALLG